jgi:choline dehydrogenase/5-(hydroxymethyl)furfural/furfural oxidase
MVAMRPVPDDYDRWATAGCAGWSYESLLPYLCELEADLDYGDAPWHGHRGPVPIQRLSRDQWGPIDRVFTDSALALGYGWAGDHNAPGASGVSPAAMTIRDGARVTANDSYVEPARMRDNLDVIGFAHVDRILLSRQRAVGVRARLHDEWTEIRAQGIVLCAGAIHSPAILLRSGIGPSGSVVRLPVGAHLQDHALAPLWVWFRDGFRRDLDGGTAKCRIRYSSELEDAGDNDMAIGTIDRTGAATTAMRGATGTWGGVAGGNAGPGPGILWVCVHQEVSRGRLRLASNDPADPPVIEENLLGERSDLVRMRDGIRRALELLSTPPFASIVASAAIDPTGRSIDVLTDDRAIDEWLLESVGDAAHVCGTCRMGAVDDSRTVVDPQGRVLGIDGLWVADASVFPEVPRANTNLPTIAAAEKIADLLRIAPMTPSRAAT